MVSAAGASLVWTPTSSPSPMSQPGRCNQAPSSDGASATARRPSRGIKHLGLYMPPPETAVVICICGIGEARGRFP